MCCQVGVVSPGVPMEIALNKESKRKTPAILAFRNGDRIFGEDAQTIGLRFPHKSYGYIIDLLGKTIDNPIVELYKYVKCVMKSEWKYRFIMYVICFFRQRFPYYNIIGDAERNTIVFKSDDDSFTVEELVAQYIQKARDFAEESTGQPITECVLIVPGFFGQAERRALLSAASLANMKVLQLINDYTAVALNYGIFRRNEINETAQYFVFYDMGAYKTSAAVVSYQLVKDKATRETNPVIQVLGVGYDRTLGGLEMQLRLRDFLAREFNNLKKTKTDVFSNPRALAKLFKEAGRVKNVLSANANHFAQIEGLLEDIDFKFQVTREIFEELTSDLVGRAVAPLHAALKNSGLSLDVINQVILFGGGTRVPKIQESLRAAIGQDLGKNINMDEAAAMGAVYRAADLATGFKVKKIITKDATVLPIQVTFERESESGNVKLIKRSLFAAMNPYPQKKVITFNKHTEDFEFNVNYAELEHVSEHEVAYLGSLNLTTIRLLDVAKLLADKAGDERTESKGIKAHFALDESGVFAMTSIELVLEKTIDDSADEESSLSKLGNTISKLFSSEKDDLADVKTDDDQQPDEATNRTEDTAPVLANATEEAAINKTDIRPKIVIVKEPIVNSVRILFANPLEGDRLTAAKKKIDDLNEVEQKKVRRENALNLLETFVIDTNQKMDEKEYASCATEKDVEVIRAACAKVSDWLYEEGEDADAATYEMKLSDLKKLTENVYARHWEHGERPEAVKTLKSLIASAREFHTNGKNLTKEVNKDRDVFTPVELETLGKKISDSETWLKQELSAQEKLARHEPVRLTVKSMTEKMSDIDREVKYLVNKLKIWKPKVPKIPKSDKKKSAAKNGTDEVVKTDESSGDDKPIYEEPTEDNEPELDILPSETENEADQPKHSEL